MHTAWGFTRSIWFGNSVAAGADVTGDNVPDMLGAAPLRGATFDVANRPTGGVRVISGDASISSCAFTTIRGMACLSSVSSCLCRAVSSV